MLKVKKIFIYFVFIITFLLRIIGIKFCNGMKYAHIDESVVVFYTIRFFTTKLNPVNFFDYSTLHLYILFFIYVIIWIFSGKDIDSFVGIYLKNPFYFYFWARILSIFFSIFSLFYFLKFFDRKDYKSKILAGLFFAFLPINVLHSHYGTIDISSSFFYLLSSYFILRFFQKRTLKSMIIASFITGMGMSVKYYPGVLYLNLILSYFLIENHKRPNIIYLLITPFIFMLGFIVTNPYSVLDFSLFAQSFKRQFFTHIGHKIYFKFNFLNYIKYIYLSTNVVFLFLVIIGIRTILKNKKDLLMFSFFISVYLLFSFMRNAKIYFSLPFYPFLIYFAVKGLNRMNRKVMILFFLITIGLFFKRDVYILKILTSLDTREISKEWVLKNIPKGSSILRTHYTPEFQNSPYRVKVDWWNRYKDMDLENLSFKFDYVISSSPNYIKGKPEPIAVFIGQKTKLSSFHNPDVYIYELK